jgi:hypothetical protein
MRWWGSAWLKSLREVQEQQREAAIKAQQINGPKAPWKVNTHANRN